MTAVNARETTHDAAEVLGTSEQTARALALAVDRLHAAIERPRPSRPGASLPGPRGGLMSPRDVSTTEHFTADPRPLEGHTSTEGSPSTMTTTPETSPGADLSPRMTAVMTVVAQHPDGVRADAVAAATGDDPANVRSYLRRLTDAGRITRLAPGRYAPHTPDETPETEEHRMPASAAIDPDDFEVVDLEDEPDQSDQADDQQPAVAGSLADELAQAQARADRLRAEMTAQQQAQEAKRQERADEYDRRQIAAFDPVALAA
ncbi:MAG: hypothetical protein M3P96_07655, partial [Actinomycetota bacterium]|nr:hypothetical protein [Actinomycetota bacterium]